MSSVCILCTHSPRCTFSFVLQLIAMTYKLTLLQFLFLLTVSSFVSCRHLLGVEDRNVQNTTVSNYTLQYNNETLLQPTSGTPQTTEVREERSAAAPATSQNNSETAHGQPSQGNGTYGNLYNIDGTETNSTKHQSAGNGSLAGTESPPQTSLPEKNGSSDPTMPNSAPTFSASVKPRNGANATNPVPTVVTTPHVSTDGPSRSRTTVKPLVPSTTELRTTPNHTPTKPHSTKVCPTAEPKREGLVSRCLIAIASLTGLATIFIMTTIILATKLAGSRYRQRAGLLHETEMVCISALMNDSDHPIPTPKHPKSNGALIPITEDEDGDDLTLNSFLHDTEAIA